MFLELLFSELMWEKTASFEHHEIEIKEGFQMKRVKFLISLILCHKNNHETCTKNTKPCHGRGEIS